jgi:hypothetical protein
MQSPLFVLFVPRCLLHLELLRVVGLRCGSLAFYCHNVSKEKTTAPTNLCILYAAPFTPALPTTDDRLSKSRATSSAEHWSAIDIPNAEAALEGSGSLTFRSLEAGGLGNAQIDAHVPPTSGHKCLILGNRFAVG